MLKRTALFLALCLTALISPWASQAQNTQITASHVAYFGGTLVTGKFCVTPTNQLGQPITIVTPLGQQMSPQVPLCFPITSGVLSNTAIVPDTSLTQPVNACYAVTINNFFGQQVGVFPCVQPSGTTWSFDAYVPSSLPSIPALTLPQFQTNGVTNASQASLNIVGSGVTYGPTPGDVHVGGGSNSLVTYLAAGLLAPGYGHVDPSMITGGITDAFQAINAVAATLPTGSMVDAYALGTATYNVATQLTALNQSGKSIVLLQNPGTRFQINTVFSSPTNTPASCAVPVGGASGAAGTGSAIVVPGYNAINANFFLGASAVVQDVICNGDFTGSQNNLHLDGVVVAGNQSATMHGALMHLAGVFVPTQIANSGTLQCFGQCLEIDAGTTGTGGPAVGNISFVNDNFQDGYSGSAVYPGSVVNIDALASSGQTSNINFYGGMVQLNGPHNALFTANGRASAQSDSIGLFGTTFQGASATPAATYSTTATASSGASSLAVASATNLAAGQMVTGTGIATGTFVADSYTSGTTIPITIATTAALASGSVTFSPNVDPIQLKDTSSFYVSNLRFRGGNNTTWQQNLIDIAGSGANRDFGINLNQVTGFSGQFNCLVRNVIEGTCEPGFPSGWGVSTLPPYTFGQIMPSLRQTSYAPPSGSCLNGSIWTNSAGTTTANTISQCVGNVWVPINSGSVLLTATANQTVNSGCALFCQFQVGAMNNEFNLAGFPSSCTTSEGNFGTQLECAWYQIYDYAVLATARPVLNLGYGNFNIAHSLAEPTKTFTGISVHGVGKQASNIVVNAQLTDAAIYKNETDVAGTLPSLSFTGFKISASNNSYLAGGCMRIWGVQELVREHVNCINVPGGATGNAPFYYQIGEPSNYGQGWVFQQSALDVIAGAKPTQPTTPATITPSLSGGNLTLTVTSGGAGYTTNTTQIPYLVLMGNQAGTSDQPCSVMPSATSIGLTSGAVSTLTFSGGTGCSGTIEARIVEIPNIAIGYDEWSTDSDLHDYVPVGAIVGMKIHGGNTRVYGAHPTATIIGIQNVGNDVFFGPYMDTTYQWGMDFEQASPYLNPATVFGAQGYNNAANFAVFHINATAIPKFHGMNALCANTTPGDFHEFLGPTGTVEQTGWSVLNGGELLGNDTTCSAITLGDYLPKLTVANLTATSCTGCGSGSSPTTTPWVFNAAGAASTPALSITGLPFAGTGTTSTPQFYLNSGSTPPTDWSTTGTHIGVNAASGSTADFMRFHVNGVGSVWSMNFGGSVISNGSYTVGASNGFVFSGRTKITSPADSQLGLANNAGTGFSRLIFGNTASASFPAFCLSGTTITACLGDNSGPASFSAATPTTGDNTTKAATTAFVQSTLAAPPAIGNTTPAAGSFTALTATSLSVGSSPPTACGSATGCWASKEGSTAGTPTAGQDYLRADSTSHTIVQSINGGAEASLPGSVVAVPTPLTAQAANITTPVTIYTTPAANHYYQVCVEADLTRAATTSSTMVSTQIDYTSAVDSAVKVANVAFSPGQTGNATFVSNPGCAVLFVKASTTVQWATVGYASSGATTMQYSLSGTVQLIQ